MIYGLLHTDQLAANVQFENDCKKLFKKYRKSEENRKRKREMRFPESTTMMQMYLHSTGT